MPNSQKQAKTRNNHMTASDDFFTRTHALLDRLEQLLPGDPAAFDASAAMAYRWQARGLSRSLVPVKNTSRISLSDLQCIDRQKQEIDRNTRQFLQNLPANHVLLWGPRGTGKSSLIKALLNEYHNKGLRLIEVEKEHLVDLPVIVEKLDGQSHHYILFCDDLSFEANDPSYKAMKVVIDGSISSTPDNILIYATSNRRHLMPEYMSENQQSKMVEGELHLSETIEEKISLSERFGLWLAFHPFNQDQYLIIVDYWMKKLQVKNPDTDTMHKAALKWALEHGSRSGRSAWQFARDWTGRHLLGK
jgi:predicted AAA+ superfamily ATPase